MKNEEIKIGKDWIERFENDKYKLIYKSVKEAGGRISQSEVFPASRELIDYIIDKEGGEKT
jgi:hypothetical protein